MKNCSSNNSICTKSQGNKSKNVTQDSVKLQKALNPYGFKKQSSRYQCQNLTPQKAAKQQLIQCDRYSPDKKQKVMDSYDQNCLISGWIDRYLDSTNMQKQIGSPQSRFLLSRTRREETENSDNFHNFIRARNQRAMNQTARISSNVLSLNEFSSIPSRDNNSTQIILRNVLGQASNRQARAATSVRNRMFRNFQNNYEEENTIPQLKKLLKKLESPQKKQNYLKKWEKKTLIKEKRQQPESYENFIERLKNRRAHTTKVEQILKSKQNKLNKDIPISPNNLSQIEKNKKKNSTNPIHDSIIHFHKLNKKCKNGNGNQTPSFFSKRYQEQRYQRTLKSILK